MLYESCSTSSFCQNNSILIFSQPWFLLFQFVSYSKPPSEQGGYFSDTWREALTFWVSLCLLWTGQKTYQNKRAQVFWGLYLKEQEDISSLMRQLNLLHQNSVACNKSKCMCQASWEVSHGGVCCFCRYGNVWVDVGIPYSVFQIFDRSQTTRQTRCKPEEHSERSKMSF